MKLDWERMHKESRKEYDRLEQELKALRLSMSGLGIHNLKQGIVLAQMGVEPEDLAKVSINKIKADAVRDFADYMQDYEVDPHGFNDHAIKLATDYANQMEQGQ